MVRAAGIGAGATAEGATVGGRAAEGALALGITVAGTVTEGNEDCWAVAALDG